MKHFIILISLTAFSCCASNTIGSKLYLEKWRWGTRIHVDRSCSNYGKMSIVAYVDTIDLVKRLTDSDIIPFCPKCVTDQDADLIESIIKRGKAMEDDISNTEDKVSSLYQTFISEGYDMEDEQEFRKNLQDPKKRKAAYDALVNDGYDMEPYEQFEANLGF